MKGRSEIILDMRRFRTIVDVYGGDSSKWPEAEREAALELVSCSAEAFEIVEEAKRLDRLLAELPVQEASSALKSAIARIPKQHQPTAGGQEGYSWQKSTPLGAVWKTALAATLAMVIGVITGVATLEPVVTSNNQTGWEDFSSLAFVPDLDRELAP